MIDDITALFVQRKQIDLPTTTSQSHAEIGRLFVDLLQDLANVTLDHNVQELRVSQEG